MKSSFEILEATRRNTLNLLNSLTSETLNIIPEGFTGNIIWHAGHMVQTHRGLIYKLSGLPSGLEKDFILKYAKGSFPETDASDQEINFIKEQLIHQVDDLKKDWEAGIFKEYHAYETSYGYTLTNIEEAIHFSNVHQSLHLGYMMAMKRAI